MVTYLRPTKALDPYSGLPTGLDWMNPQRVDAPAAFILNSSTSETTDGQSDSATVGWVLYIPEGEVEPHPGDKVELDGVTFAQNGRPLRERNPFTGWAPYAQVRLTMQEGD